MRRFKSFRLGNFAIRATLNGVQRRRRKPGGEAEMVPAVPDKPKPLSGGAAAELEFGE